MGPRTGLDDVEKREISCPCGNRTLAVLPVASRYTDSTTTDPVPCEVILSVITSNLLILIMSVTFNASRPLQGYILFRICRNVCDPCPLHVSLTQPQKISCLEVLRATLVCCSHFVLHVHPIVACLT
jgi:hypothetical protein